MRSLAEEYDWPRMKVGEPVFVSTRSELSMSEARSIRSSLDQVELKGDFGD